MKRFIQSYVFITQVQKKCSTKKKKFLSGDVTFRLPDASYRCEPTQNYVNMSLKKFLCAVSMLPSGIREVVSPEENILMCLKGKPALFEKGISLVR